MIVISRPILPMQPYNKSNLRNWSAKVRDFTFITEKKFGYFEIKPLFIFKQYKL